MIDFLNETRAIYEAKRGKFGLLEKMFLKMKKPSWLGKENDDRFDFLYDDQEIIYSEGKVVYALLMQANSMLFKHSNHASPGTVIYSLDPHFEQNFDELREIGKKLIGLITKPEERAAVEDSEVISFMDGILNDNLRHFNIKVPALLTGGREVFFTTIMFHREYIPSRLLLKRIMPILVCPEKTPGAILLPGKYWSKGLEKYWFEKVKK